MKCKESISADHSDGRKYLSFSYVSTMCFDLVIDKMFIFYCIPDQVLQINAKHSTDFVVFLYVPAQTNELFVIL